MWMWGWRWMCEGMGFGLSCDVKVVSMWHWVWWGGRERGVGVRMGVRCASDIEKGEQVYVNASLRQG